MVFKSLTVWVQPKRSSRIYKEHVQYNDRTDKKLEGFLPHAQHLLPPTDRGEEEGLTACSDCSLRVQQRFHELSITGRAKNVNFRRLTRLKSVI